MTNVIINPTAGDQTSTWYEWYTGIDFLVELINPSSVIKAVIFQADDSQKLDDIVVRYKDGTEKRFQIKHTTGNSTLGLEELINTYLEDFSSEWYSLYNTSNDLKFILYTNRKSSDSWNGNKKSGKYLRPKLCTFWSYIKSKVNNVKSIDEIVMEDTEWETVWGKFLDKIAHLNTKKEDLRFKFLENFYIQLAQPSMVEHNDRIIKKIEKSYSVDTKRANDILDKIKSKLSDWTTKEGKLRRKTQEVTSDMIVQALFETSPNHCIGNHNLPVIANGFESRKKFASKLKDILIQTDKKIVFLSGSPQSGKTTLVSYLYSVEKTIDFRFHAFKPIMADNSNMGSDKGVSTYRGLWGDLYIQIVEYIYETTANLDEINIVPFVDWIDDDDLQSETLRILGALGEKLKRKIIVAIDGIDHAARSGEEETFLNRFCYPDNLPENVCLLIVGQPFEAYKHKYPSWIIDARYVEMCDIPAIEKEDVTLLLSSLPVELDKNIIKDIIFEASNGNTLSAVFAAKEAEKCRDIESFRTIIENRNLKCGVDVYYKKIWEYCKSEIASYITTKEHISEIELSIAIVLSIIERPLSVDLFSEINKELNLPQHAWVSIFEKLQPMVIVNDSKISCEISDVRVFFKGHTSDIYTTKRLNEIKVKLAKCFYANDEYIYERHYINYDLLRCSEQLLFTENLNGEYISDAFIIGQKVVDIRNQIQFAVSTVMSNKRDDLFTDMCASLKIFEQFIKSTDYAGYVYKEAVNDFYFLTGEITPYQTSYTFKELEGILDDALLLYEKGKFERSRTIVNKHFSNRDINEIINIFCKERNDKIEIYSYYQPLIQGLGELCRYCKKNIFAVSQDNISKIDKRISNSFMNNFFKGWFVATAKNEYKEFEKTFSLLPIMVINNELFIFLRNAYTNGNWVNILENMDLICSFKPSKPVVLQLLSWQIQNRNINDSFNITLDDIRKQGINFLNEVYFETFETNEYKMLSFINLAFCLGYCNQNVNFTHLVNKYYDSLDVNEHRKCELMLRANYKIGFAFSNTSILGDSKVFVNAHLKNDSSYYSHLYLYEYVNDMFNKMMKLSFDMYELRTSLFSESKKRLTLLENEPKWNYIVSPIILPFLYSLGEKRQTIDYMYKIAGEKGIVWNWSLTGRTSELPSIARCAEQINMPYKFMMQLDEYRRCFANGYTEDKEDVLYSLVTCLGAIMDIRPDLWKNYLDEIIQITLLTEAVSENNSLLAVYNIFAACAYNESVEALYQLITTAKVKCVDNKIHIIHHVFLEQLNANSIELKDALMLWEFFYKYFNKPQEFSAYEKKWLAETKDAVQLYCSKNNFDIQEFCKIEQVNECWNYQTSESIADAQTADSYLLDELLIKFEIDSNKMILRGSECLAFLNRIEVERPFEFNNYIKCLCGFISQQKIGYTLRSNGYDDVFLQLYKLMCNNEVFEFLDKVINSQKVENNMSLWAHAVYDIIQHFYLHLNKNEPVKIEKLLFANISVHKLILSGNGKIDLPAIYIHNIDTNKNSHEWSDILQLLS